MDEVMRITQGGDIYHIKKVTPLAVTKVAPLSIPRLKNTTTISTLGVMNTSSTSKASTSKALIKREQKDVRLATFIKSFFSR
jgi:aspartate carbamoyltransferase regulatory subunit